MRSAMKAMLVLAALQLAACGGGGGGSSSSASSSSSVSASAPAAPAPAPAQAQLPSNFEIADLLYTDRQRTPAGFGSDTTEPSQGYAATMHLKNVDAPTPSAPYYELCTDDWNEALAWTDQAASRSSVYGDLVETNTTDRYFEFGRVSRTAHDSVTRLRVFRCEYLDRSGADVRATGYAGEFNKAAPAAGDLRSLVEYLWTFTAYNNFGNVVLKSEGSARASGLDHSLTMAKLTRGASGSCDDVEVFVWRHTFDATTGVLSTDMHSASHFRARQVGAQTEVCSN